VKVNAEYAGLAAATLANALAPNPEDAERVGIGLFAVVFAQCFSTGAVSDDMIFSGQGSFGNA